MNKRAIILSTVLFCGFAIVGIRLADLMLVNHETLANKAKSQHQGSREVSIARGNIYDRQGRELAVNMDSISVFGNPQDIKAPSEAAVAVSRWADKSYETILASMNSRKPFVWLSRKLEVEAAHSIRSLKLDGIGFIPEAQRYYPKGSLAAHVLGFVGVDNQPLEGVELQYDDHLKGSERKIFVTRDAAGRTLSKGMDYEPLGNNVILTIDEGLQYIVENALYEAASLWNATSAIGVMMDPYTGELLALANWPTYDLNTLSESSVSHRRNRSITDPYEPGSTFKLITAAAALEEGAVKIDDLFDISDGYIDIGPMRVHDSHRKDAKITFAEIIKTSSNVGTIMVGNLMREEVLHKYIKAFGFGARTGIDLPGENAGVVHSVDKWSQTSQAAMSIGYEVSVTPLQILRAYSAVANGGKLVTPHLVREVRSPEGESIYRFDSSTHSRAVSVRTANTLKNILVSVTQEGGTALGASVEGNLVAGKTGTARLIDPETGEYSREKYVSSFVGFVPAERPKFSLVIVIFEPENKYYGGTVAAPVFKQVATQALSYLNVPREDMFKENVLLVHGGRWQ
jgi:cell division protein FtsI/penicillin-binding protein 2